MSMTPMSSEEKDPTCVVKMLECLRPTNQRTSGIGRPTGSRRGASVVTRLMFDESLVIDRTRPVNISNRKRILEHDVHFRSIEKKVKGDIPDPPIPASPWEVRLIQADLANAKAQIQVLQNVNNEHHRLRKEQEQVFENEKGALQLKLQGATDMMKDLESRVKVLTRRHSDTKEELLDLKSQLVSHRVDSSEKLRALEKQNAELRDELSTSQLGAQKSNVSVQWRVTQLESELKTARDTADEHQTRAAELLVKLQDAKQNAANAEILEQQLQDAQLRLKRMECEKEENKEALAMAKLQQHKLLAYPDMERDMQRLKEDNAKLRGLVQNKLLLEEKVTSLQARLATSEERDREMVQLQTSRKNLEQSLDDWLTLAREIGHQTATTAAAGADKADDVKPAAVRQRFEHLQQRELQLAAEIGDVKSRLRAAVEERKTIVSELEASKKQVEKLTNMQELQKNYTHRVNKKLTLVTMERNSYRTQLDSYERDLTMPSTTALLNSQHEQQRARIEALEKAVDGYRELVEGDADREKRDVGGAGSAEQLAQIKRLESEKEALHRTNVQLKRKQEELELELQYRALKGDFNPMKSKVLHFRLNPQSEAEGLRGDELSIVQAECARLREKVRVLLEGQTDAADLTLITDDRLRTTNSQEVLELRNQLKSSDLKIQRLKEAFKVTTGEFREIVYMVLGYRIDRNNNLYNLSSMYAESPDDIITFKYNTSQGNVELIETPFSNTLESLIDLHLRRQHSIPVFLSAVTLDLFSQQTMATLTEPTNY